jgi:hypothetical protein
MTTIDPRTLPPMRPVQKLTRDQRFFFDHAGYSYPVGSDPATGRTACACRLADAEETLLQAMRRANVAMVWEHDDIGARYYRKRPEDTPDHRMEGSDWRYTCELAAIVNGETVLASLGAVLDADANYRRVIRAELALECLEQLQELAQ